MKNNKGMTLVEIIVSIALISITIIFLMVLFINVKDINDDAKINNTYLITKSLQVKTIEEDLENSSTLNISNCNIFEKFRNIESSKPNLCIKFQFNNNVSNIGYLGFYYSTTTSSYVTSYIHTYTDDADSKNNIDVRETRTLKDFENYSLQDNKIKCFYKYTQDSINNGAFYLRIPIIGPDYKDYTFNLSYYGNVSINNLNSICSQT